MLLPWEDMEILIGDPVSLFAQFWPDNSTVKWYKDDAELPSKHYTVDQGSSQLTLENLTETAEVSIVVTSQVTGKTASNKCKIVVHAIPIEITSKTPDSSFAIGESCSFFVDYKSESKVSAEWFHNGKIKSNSSSLTIITAGGKSQVVIQKFSKDLVGQWTCVLSDDYVSLQHSFNVTISESKIKPQSPLLKLGSKSNAVKPPKFVKQLENCTIKEGKPLKLECHLAQSTTSPHITWMHENRELKNSENCVIRYINGVASLNINKTQRSSEGQYTCNVVLSAGEEMSTKCVVKIPRDSVTKSSSKEAIKPTIKPHSKKQTVTKAGKSFELSCDILGSPQPSVKWLHNGVQFSSSAVSSNGVSKVSVAAAKDSDAGAYQCIATNDAGEAITEFSVEVECGADKPVFVRKLENAEVKEGKPLKLSAKINSFSKPKITWLLDGVEIISGENGFKLTSTEQIFTLNVANAKSESHGGNYEIQAENNAGVVSCSSQAKILSKPIVTQSLEDIFVSPGSNIALECHFIAQSVPKAVWYKNGTRLFQVRGVKSFLEGSVAKLEINNFTPSSAGVYLVKLSNNEGEVSSSCKVEIYKQPVFKKHLCEKIDAVLGKILKLECCIEGVSESNIVWYHNETVISPKVYCFEKGNLASITFENCSSEHEGTYTCIASHSGGSALSTCTVSVCALPEIQPLVFCENLELVANDSLKLSVQVSGKPTPTLQWFFKDNLIHEKTNLKLTEHNSVYEICLESVTTQNSGEYLCVAKNSAGVSKLACLVSVVAKGRTAQFSKNLESISVKEGSKLKLETNFNAFGSFTSKWFLDTHEVKETQTIKINEKPTSSTLIVENSERCWAGTYLYEVVNRFGRSATSCNVTVLFKPVFTKKLDSHFYVNRSSASTMEVVFEGQPVPEVSWKRDDQVLEPTEQLKIHSTETKSILHVSEPQGGKYTCLLTNEIGSTESTCQVVVMDVPKFEKPLQDKEAKEGEDVVLECSIIAFPLPEVSWFFNDKKLDPESETCIQMNSSNMYTLLIKNASKTNHGTFKIVASNQAGTNAQTCSLKVCDIPEITCLRNNFTDEEIAVEENDEFEIDFSVKLKSEPVIKWFFKDQPIVNSIRVQTKLRAGIAKLYITKCSAEDSGEYSIVVKSNSDGTQRSQKFFVQVYTKPTFQTPLKKTMKVITQQELVLECKVSGFPEPMLFWYHDNEILEDNDRLSIDYENGLATLKIASCYLDDSGVYNCKAINTVATTSSSCDVNIYSFPEFQQGLSDIVIEKGKNIELVCKVSAHPPPSVKWYQKGRELRNSNDIHVSQSGDEFSLVIKNSKFSHAAEYTCKASNIVGEASSQCYVEVGTLPVFKQELKKMTDIISGNKLVLQIEYTSRPIPEVKWFRDGTELSLEDEKNCSFYHDEKSIASLTFDPVNIDHQGFYECVVENVMSSAKCDCRVFVYSIPKFVDALENVEIVENEDLALRCKVIGHPEPKVAWSFNSKELDDIQNEDCDLEYDQGIAILKIAKVKRVYSGTFACKAFNSAGESSSECAVEILVLPTFLEFPSKKDVEIDCGDNFEIEAKFEGAPLPAVSWFKNENRLEQSGNCSINIDENTALLKVVNCQAEDSAIYKCCLTNKLSTVSRQLNIVILSAPVFNLENDFLNLNTGDVYIFDLKVIGSPKPSLTCTVNKQPISKFPQLALKEKDFKLEFKEVDPKLAGNYNFKVENKVGKNEFDLKVNVLSAPSFLKPLESQQVNIGDDLYLLVTLNKCFPEPSLLWKHNDRPLVVSEEFGILMRCDGDQYILIRENVSFDFVGEYTCEVSNSQGKTECRAKITVEELLIKPKFEKILRDALVDESKPLEVVCHFVASPKPTITWLKDSEQISESDDSYKITRAQKTATLKIDSAQLKDSGLYMVRISNKIGEIQTSFKVSVKELIIKPKILQQLKDISTIEFETIVLQCTFEAKPAPEITWYFNNVALTKKIIGMLIETSASDSKLILESVGVKRAGNYKCRVKNKAGMTSSACKVDIEVKPIPPALIMDDVMDVSESSDITVKCLIEGNPFPGIKWIKNDKVITDTKYYDMYVNSGGVACLGFREVRVEDYGVYQCLAVNAYGEARKNIELIVNRKPVRPEVRKQLANKIVREGQPCVMTCEISGYPIPEIQCFHEGYELDSDSHVQITYEEEVVTLSIEKTELDHAGVYSIKAKNEVDLISVKAKLTVQAAPKTKPVFEIAMENCDAIEGEIVTLSNKIVAHPAPNISWLHGGRRIISTKNQELKFSGGFATLCIKKVMKTQSGEYTCIASNSEGETRVSCNLTTKASQDAENRMLSFNSLTNVETSAPQILRDLRDIVCQEGQNITLECKFMAARVNITWKLNGNPIKPNEDFVITKNEDITSLQIRNTKMINEGQFSVTLENPMGLVESTCQVSVGQLPEKNLKDIPPHFIKPLQDMDVEDGQRVVLECKVGGPEPIEVHWLFAGEEIQSHGDFKISYQFGIARLEILEVFPEDCGDYLCLARNDFGHVKTECFVNVLEAEEIARSSEDSPGGSRTPEKPILIKELPEELMVIDGDPCILEVKVKCVPDPEVIWMYNGEAIEMTEYLSSNFQNGIAQLKFEDIYPTDAGLYECRIQNKVGFVTSSCMLSVDEEMKTEEILIQLQQSLSNENFRGIKSPSRHSSGSIRESPSSNTMSSLNVHQWTIDKSLKMRKQSGKVAVLTSDLQDRDFVPAISNVRSDKPPFLVKKLRDLNVEHAESFKMECKLSHRSDAEVAWFLNGLQVKSNDNILITFEDKIALFEVLKATPELSGEIMCKAINQAGDVSSRCQIKVFPKMRVAPQFASELCDVTCEEQDNLTLTCDLDCDSETEVEWYFNDRALPKFSKDIKMIFDNPVAKLEINSAMVLDSGRYTCEAFNSVGESYSWCDVCVQEVVSGLSPIFVDKLVNKTVMEGEPCELLCTLQEYRGVEVKWLLNGKPLVVGKDMDIVQNGNLLKVVFTKTRVANGGKYTCKAIGRSSSTWTGCEVTVGGVPKFVNKLENTKVQISDDLYLQCELSGHPVPSVAWFHNKKPVKVMRNYNTGYQGQKAWLKIEKSDLKHAGEYLCKISNSFGEAISVCEVGVGASPGFLEELEDILVVTDKSFQLVCEISGVPSPYIEWYHPDEHTRLKLSRNVRTKFIDGTATLLIDRATEEMAGIYHCKALNSFGKAVSTCKVTIGSLPEVLTNIEDQNVTVGETVKFECMFSSETNPIVVWLLNGCNVSGIEGVEQEIGSDWASLTFASCLASQAGEYVCKIVNDFGEVLSKATLSVGSPPVFTKKPREMVKLSEGKALKLTAEIDGSPRPKFEWIFNDSPIEKVCPDVKITSRDNILFLDIDNMTSKYAGKYLCNLTNDFGSDQSMTKVIIGCSPEISNDFPSELRVNIGEPLVILCEYTAFPEPEVFWFKDKRQLSEKAGEIIFSEPKNNAFQLKYLNAKAGLYSVKLKNNYGEITADCKVEVGGKPVLVKPLKNERLTEGMNSKIQCEFSSMPEAQITWLINGVVITKYSRDHKLTSKEGKVCLEIHKANSTYFGEHKVKASNMFGETVTSCEVENALFAKKPSIRTLDKPERSNSLAPDDFSAGYKSHTIARTSAKSTPPEIEYTKKEVTRSLSDSKSKQEKQQAEKNEAEQISTSEPKKAEISDEKSCKKEEKADKKTEKKLQKVENTDEKSSKISMEAEKAELAKAKTSEKVETSFKKQKEESKETLAKTSKTEIAEKSEESLETPRTPKEKRKTIERKTSMRELKPTFSQDLPSSTSLKTGEKLELLCQSSNDLTAQTEVSWFHNGTVLRPFLGVETSVSGKECKLTIVNLKLRHSGKYECKLVNKNGQSITSSDVKVSATSNPALQFAKRNSTIDISKQESMIQLPSDTSDSGQISKKPAFTRKLTDARLFGGDNLKLECAVTGYPEPTVKWFRDSQRLPEFSSIENDKIAIEVPNVTTQHAGIYMCKVTNSAGSVSCTCRVTITGTLRRRNSLMAKSKATLLETPVENKELKIKTSEENVVKLRGSKDALTISEVKKKTLSCMELETVHKDDQKTSLSKLDTPKKIEELPEIKESPKKDEKEPQGSEKLQHDKLENKKSEKDETKKLADKPKTSENEEKSAKDPKILEPQVKEKHEKTPELKKKSSFKKESIFQNDEKDSKILESQVKEKHEKTPELKKRLSFKKESEVHKDKNVDTISTTKKKTDENETTKSKKNEKVLDLEPEPSKTTTKIETESGKTVTKNTSVVIESPSGEKITKTEKKIESEYQKLNEQEIEKTKDFVRKFTEKSKTEESSAVKSKLTKQISVEAKSTEKVSDSPKAVKKKKEPTLEKEGEYSKDVKSKKPKTEDSKEGKMDASSDLKEPKLKQKDKKTEDVEKSKTDESKVNVEVKEKTSGEKEVTKKSEAKQEKIKTTEETNDGEKGETTAEGAKLKLKKSKSKESSDSKDKDVKNADVKETKEAKEAKDLKETKDSKAKELKEAKDSKEAKDLKETKDSKAKELKEAKNSKEAKDLKETKDSKEAKDLKETKDSKETKDLKEAKDLRDAKDLKKAKDSKEPKDLKETKDSKEGKITKKQRTNETDESQKSKVSISEEKNEEDTKESKSKTKLKSKVAVSVLQDESKTSEDSELKSLKLKSKTAAEKSTSKSTVNVSKEEPEKDSGKKSIAKSTSELKSKTDELSQTKEIEQPILKINHADINRISFSEEKTSDLNVTRPKKITCNSQKCKPQCLEKSKQLALPSFLTAPKVESKKSPIGSVKRDPSQDESDQSSTPTQQLSRSSSRKDVLKNESKFFTASFDLDEDTGTLEKRPATVSEAVKDENSTPAKSK